MIARPVSLEISVTRQISTIFEYLLGSIVLQSEIGSTVLQILQNHGINDKFCHLTDGFANMRKHGFCSKTSRIVEDEHLMG